MLKKYKTGLFIVASLTLCAIVFSCFFYPNKLEAEGYLLLRSPSGDNELVLLDVFTRDVIDTKAHGFRACFAGNPYKLLTETPGVISCIDIKDDATVWDYQISDEVGLTSMEFAYVKDSTFSVSLLGQLRLINMNIGTNTILKENTHLRHSWSADGETVYYSINDIQDKIYKYNIVSGEEEYLFEGVCPSVSDDENTIAYLRNSRLIVKNLMTSEEWTYSGNSKHFCISPNGKYVAIVTENAGIFHSPVELLSDKVLVWEYSSNKSYVVLSDYPSGQSFDLDWID